MCNLPCATQTIRMILLYLMLMCITLMEQTDMHAELHGMAKP